MFRKAIFCLAVFMFGIISSQDLFVPAIEDKGEFTIEINGNLSINTEINTNNEIMHQQIDNEPLKSFINVEGIINYSIGARNSREYGIFFGKSYYYSAGWGGGDKEWKNLRTDFFPFIWLMLP